jgi:phage-related protein
MITENPQEVLSKVLEGIAKPAPEMRKPAMHSIFGRGPSGVIGKLVDNLDLYKKNLQLGMALAGAAFRSFFKIGPLAFIGIAPAVYENWDRVKSFFSGIWSFAEPHWNNFKLVLQEYAVVDKIIAAWTAVRDFFATLWNAATPHWNAFIEKIQSLNIADKIMASWQKLKMFFTGIWDDIAPKWDAFTAPLSKIWDGAKSSVSSIGSLFKSDETKPSIASKLPPLSGAKSAPVTKNQNVTNNITVNASKISDPREVAKQVSKEMKSFNWAYLYDPVGVVP